MLDIKRMKDIRVAKGLSQIEMAIIVGVTANTYRNWELGANLPSEENLIKLEQKINQMLNEEKKEG